MLYSVELGKNIVELRNLEGISQEQLALRSNVSVSYLRDIEHGRVNPTIDILESIAKTLKVDLMTLFLYSLEIDEIQTTLEQSKENAARAKQNALV